MERLLNTTAVILPKPIMEPIYAQLGEKFKVEINLTKGTVDCILKEL